MIVRNILVSLCIAFALGNAIEKNYYYLSRICSEILHVGKQFFGALFLLVILLEVYKRYFMSSVE